MKQYQKPDRNLQTGNRSEAGSATEGEKVSKERERRVKVIFVVIVACSDHVTLELELFYIKKSFH